MKILVNPSELEFFQWAFFKLLYRSQKLLIEEVLWPNLRKLGSQGIEFAQMAKTIKGFQKISDYNKSKGKYQMRNILKPISLCLLFIFFTFKSSCQDQNPPLNPESSNSSQNKSPSNPSPPETKPIEVGQSVYGTDHRWTARPHEQCLSDCGGAQNTTCMNFCQRSGLIIGLIAGLIGAALIIAVVTCILYRRNMCMFWPCHQYQKLRKLYNKIDPGQVTEQEFLAIGDRIVENFDHSKTNKTHYHTIEDKNYKIKAEAWIEKESAFCSKLTLKGSDNYSKFKAYGYIICRNGGEIFLWFYKKYKKRDRAGQVGAHQHLIYESVKVDQLGSIVGKWYYLGDQQNGNVWGLYSSQNYLNPESGGKLTRITGSSENFPTHPSSNQLDPAAKN